MTIIIVVSIAALWILLSALVVVFACMRSSQLSQSEDLTGVHDASARKDHLGSALSDDFLKTKVQDFDSGSISIMTKS